MTISGVSSNLAPLIQSALDINKQLDDLQTQLGSGQKSTTYAGLGSQSGIAVALGAQLSTINSFDDTIANIGTTVSLQQTVLQQIASIGNTVRSSATQLDFAIDGTGQTTSQKTAASMLDQMLSLLNTQGSNGYLFSGSGTSQPSVDSADHILNGNGAQAGLKQVIAERNQADLGADGLGRLVIPSAVGTTVAVSEDAAGSPFGLKLAAVNSTSPARPSPVLPARRRRFPSISAPPTPTTATASATHSPCPTAPARRCVCKRRRRRRPDPTNSPSARRRPRPRQTSRQRLPPASAQIGSTSLSAASAMAASNDFFDDPPQRVSGSPATATSLVNGTSADTVIWYTGEDGSGSARSTATARIDPSTTVSYGTRANEQGIRWIVQNLAALAATSYSSSDATASNSYSALNSRVYAALGVPAGVQNISDIESSLANAQSAMASTKSLHQQTTNMLTTMQQSIEGVDTTQIGAQILSLQTSLSASLSTTARMASLNLLSYLSPVTG